MRPVVVMLAFAGALSCGPEPTPGADSIVAEPAFNGSFEDPKTFPPAITLVDGSTLQPYPSNIPTGWTIDPAPPWPQDPRQPAPSRNAWHEGIHARYGIGVFPAPPDPRIPNAPDAVSLFVASCDPTTPMLCDYPFVVRSRLFDVAEGTRYVLRLWYRSVLWWAPAPQPHALFAGVSWRGADGTEVSNSLIELAPNAAPQNDWTEATADFTAPLGSTRAQVLLKIEKHNRDLYVDGIRFVPTP